MRWLLLTSALIVATLAHAEGVCDRFGVRELCPTPPGGREWFSRWDNGHARQFGGAVDPDDPWFDTDHGEATYRLDGQGALRATGDYVRMYVHHPDHQTEWGENLEITVYVTRVSEAKRVSYSGLQIFARTNHGTLGSEATNLADDRGYGAKVTLDGRWEFEKETAHHRENGYATAGTVHPWAEWPVGQCVGVKYVLRNQRGGTQVKLELYRDLTGGAQGGKWEKLAETVDTGDNWGREATPCKPGVRPELALLRPLVLPASETGKPMLTVYFRHEYATMEYRRASIREIAPLP